MTRPIVVEEWMCWEGSYWHLRDKNPKHSETVCGEAPEDGIHSTIVHYLPRLKGDPEPSDGRFVCLHCKRHKEMENREDNAENDAN